MVYNCVVQGCKSVSFKGSKIRFHGFPKDDARRNLWLSIVPLKTKFYESARICSLHFDDCHYDKPDSHNTKRFLKKSAIPFFKDLASLKNECGPLTCSQPSHITPIIDHDYSATPEHKNSFVASLPDQPMPEKINKNSLSEINCDCALVKLKSRQVVMLEKKIRSLQQTVARQAKNIKKFKSLISEVRSYTRELDIENIVHGRFAELSKKLKQKPKRPEGVQYSEEVKAFALTLYSHSPNAYHFVKQFMGLPSKDTLKRLRNTPASHTVTNLDPTVLNIQEVIIDTDLVEYLSPLDVIVDTGTQQLLLPNNNNSF